MSMPKAQSDQPATGFVLANDPVGIGDPLPWMRVRLHPQGEVNLEQFGGLRAALVFLGTAADPRVQVLMKELLAGFEAFRGETRANDFAVVPVLADLGSLEDDTV